MSGIDITSQLNNEIVVDGHGKAFGIGGGFDLLAGEQFAPGMIAVAPPEGRPRQVAPTKRCAPSSFCTRA